MLNAPTAVPPAAPVVAAAPAAPPVAAAPAKPALKLCPVTTPKAATTVVEASA